MLPDLSPHLHTRECNVLIEILKRCYDENTIGRLFGKCSYWDEAVWQCTRKERIWRRDNNPKYKKRLVELRNLPESHWTPALKKLKEEGLLPDTNRNEGSLPESPNPAVRSTRDIEIFERLRRFVPVISSEKNAFKILVDYVSEVMEIEQQLYELSEERVNPEQQRLNPEKKWYRYDCAQTLQLSKAYKNEVFPDDLASVDVSAFKHLICSQPVRMDTLLFQ